MAKPNSACLEHQTCKTPDQTTLTLPSDTVGLEESAETLQDLNAKSEAQDYALDIPHYRPPSSTIKSGYERFEDARGFEELESPSGGLTAIECTHWLEILDPLHRYGTFLQPYYDVWLSLGAPGSFFQWLDNGDGVRVDLEGAVGFRGRTVSRQILERSRVRYCTEKERQRYRVVVKDGLLRWTSENAPGDKGRLSCVNTDLNVKWIFVIDVSGELYMCRKRKGHFHHSSFVAGGPVLAAGRISVDEGHVVCIGPNSGHYRTKWDQLMFAVEDFFGKSGLRVIPPVPCDAHNSECIRVASPSY